MAGYRSERFLARGQPLGEVRKGMSMQLHDVQGTQMHCFFHLVNGEQAILDEIGVTVSDIEAAKAEALTAITELRRENDGDLAEDWKGWALQVVCTDGRVLCSIDLTSAAPTSDGSGVPTKRIVVNP